MPLAAAMAMVLEDLAGLQPLQRVRVADERPVERQRLRLRHRFDRVAIGQVDDAKHGRRSASQQLVDSSFVEMPFPASNRERA